METEKFVAPTMKEAMAKVREVLGEDTMILKSEKVRAGGPLNLFKHDLIEVTAARHEDIKGELSAGPDFAETLQGTLAKEQAQTAFAPPKHEISLLKEELKYLREDLNAIGNQLKNNGLQNMPKEVTRSFETVSKAGIEHEWAMNVVHEAVLHLTGEELNSSEQIENFMLSKLSTAIHQPPVNTPIHRRGAYKIVFVGPAGGGKTSLIQKLATDSAGYGGKKVGLISMDTHRMAAIEQIKAYSRIAGMPLEVVFNPQQISTALSRIPNCEVVLMDTPGISPTDLEKLESLREFIEAIDPDEIQLVLNATTRDEELKLTCNKFRELNVTHLCFTRLDESLNTGYLLNVMRNAQKPVSWLSNGQNYTGDLNRFRSENLKEWLFQNTSI